MSLKSKRRAILLDSEIQDLYGAPKLASEQKRYYFSLNDPELDAVRSIRDRYLRVYFVLLLGYFKVRPVVLSIRYSDMWEDLQFIAGEFFPGLKPGRKNVSPMQKVRIYRRIFKLLDYQPFDEDSEAALSKRAGAAAAASIESRYLFDESIDYLAKQRIAIPKYTVLQRMVSKAIANGTNYGLYRMAHISDRSYEELRSTQANYLRMETLNQANDAVSNAIANLEIFQHYNIQEGVLHASADGQKFESRLHTFKTRYSSKYFGTNKGVSAVTLVANHVPVNARVIGANEHESHYIFDLLFNNTSEIKPKILSTDTHGVNHVNFALLDLFDYTFAPRYAQVGRVIEDIFTVNVSDDDKPLLSLKKPIREDTIVNEWETIQRIVISLQRKTTSQAALIRKLSTYSNTHPLVQALTEYDRLVKARYLLNYIDDSVLRNYVQRALNRGEAYHQLRRAVASVNGNRFRGSSDQEIDIWNECARLLTNAIIYFNSLILSNLLAYYRDTGEQENLELVKKVSPVAWLNVNLNGTYSFTFEQNVINMAEILSPLTGKMRGLEK